MTEEVLDCVIVGAGLAGLAAAEALTGHRIAVLEAADRAGGRVRSAAHDGIWLNFGAHMFGGAESPVGRLVELCGLELRPIGGRLMGMVQGNQRLLGMRPETYPLRLRLSLRERLALVRMGLDLRRGSARSVRFQAEVAELSSDLRRARLVGFDEKRTLAAAVGRLKPSMAALLTAITERTGADPTQMSAGHGFRSFANVWSKASPGNNLAGGSARLPQALAARLGHRLRLNAKVKRVERDGTGVWRVTLAEGTSFRARGCILAVPAPVAARIAGPELSTETRAALEAVRYGAFLTAAVRLAAGAPRPWQGHYAISTPGRAFSVLFDMGITHTTKEAAEGASLMLFRGALGAATLLEQNDAEIAAAFRADLYQVFPELHGQVAEMIVQRWPLGAPYGFPGRAALEPALAALPEGLALAGDYLDFPNMDAAILAGEAAAARIASTGASV